MKQLQNREPLTEQEVIEFLDQRVEAEEKHWGKASYYARKAKEARDLSLTAFRDGAVIPVMDVSYVDTYGNGCGDYVDTLYSDGHVVTTCYGYLD